MNKKYNNFIELAKDILPGNLPEIEKLEQNKERQIHRDLYFHHLKLINDKTRK
jgi:hypothetical protein